MDVENPWRDGRSPTSGDGGREAALHRPPPDPVQGLSPAERSQREAFVDEVQRIRRMVASNSVTPGMRWSRILVPFILGTATDRGRIVLEQAFRSTNINSNIINQAATRWRARDVLSYRDAQ
eukprot:8442467-Pyramimonas_sp.AAC.1